MRNISFFVIILIVLSCSGSQQGVDSIFFNGSIYTATEEVQVEALAVRNGKIVGIGSEGQILSLKDRETEMIDLKGSTMTPGLIDTHAHFMGIGYGQLELDLSGVKSYEALVAVVKQKVVDLNPGDWILGRGWHQDKWDSISAPIVNGFPTHHLLSEVSQLNPVFLRHASGHAGLANAKAMELAGIDETIEFHEGGEVFKDTDGNPTGIFNEKAQELIGRHIPENDVKRDQLAFDKAMNECVSNGITGFHDAGVNLNTIKLYKDNLDRGNFKLRLYAMLSGSDEKLLLEYFQKGPEIGLGNDFLTIRSIKLYGDGALGSRGAWLLAPYSDMPTEKGHSTTPINDIYEISSEAIQSGFQVCTHAIGDRANREVLDQYQKAFTDNQSNSVEHRFRIEHAQHLSLQDIPRFSQMGVIPAMQAIHMSSDRPWAIDRLGRQRIEEGAYVWQKLLKSGAKVINGTDAPVEPVNPIHSFYASVTRMTLEGHPPGGYEPTEKMTRMQALKSYTLDAAFGAFEEDVKGSIEVGKYADFTIYDKNIMEVPDDQLLNTAVIMTVVNGEIVYNNGVLNAE